MTDNRSSAGSAEAVRHYLRMRERQPLKGLDDTIHAIHTGTEYAAELRLSDLRAAFDGLAQGSSKPAGAGTIWEQFAAVYGSLDAEDCAYVDREWAKWRGLTIAAQPPAAPPDLSALCKEMLSGDPMQFKSDGPRMKDLAKEIGGECAEVGAINRTIRMALEVVAGGAVETDKQIKACMDALEDVPGETLPDRVNRLLDWYQALSNNYHKDVAEAGNRCSAEIREQGGQTFQVSAERIARVLALSYGRDPDDLTQMTEMCDAENRPVPIWRVYEEQAEALLAAYSVTERNKRPQASAKNERRYTEKEVAEAVEKVIRDMMVRGEIRDTRAQPQSLTDSYRETVQKVSAAREKGYAGARANLQEAWAAMALIRETVETLGPVGAVPAAEHLDGPTFMHEAEAIVNGIQALALSRPEHRAPTPASPGASTPAQPPRE